MSSNYSYVVSIFLKFGEAIVGYFFYKSIFGFPPFCFYYLLINFFLFQSKTKNAVKDINQNFTSSKLNKKKSETNLWTFGALTDFFWNFYGKLKLLKIKNLHPEVTIFCAQFYWEAQIIFLMKPFHTSMINLAFQNKSWAS